MPILLTIIIVINYKNMFEILSYDFFQKALLAGIIVSLIAGILWSLVVLRREPNITHSIANILFLGIVVSFFFHGNYYVFGILFALLWVLLLILIEKFSLTARESSKEIIAQIGLAWGIFWVGIIGNMQLDIFNFLFWNILFIEYRDIALLAGILLIGAILWLFFGKKLLRVILSPEISKSQWISTQLFEIGYLIYLALFIAVTIKMFWALLLWAFLVLPSNIAKTISKSFRWVFIWATALSIIAVCAGLFASYYFDTSAWATIVLLLWITFLVRLAFSKIR